VKIRNFMFIITSKSICSRIIND